MASNNVGVFGSTDHSVLGVMDTIKKWDFRSCSQHVKNGVLILPLSHQLLARRNCFLNSDGPITFDSRSGVSVDLVTTLGLGWCLW
ncbi:hypothetical protein L195_g010676 [Trifolium pratense]|uniref:Uncharacterized protein n=1 Tax=Trifolium pratense TaxID=57577 RepID=A0A2K3PFD8_TRIPR|nr:hypothetical protein L195_g010676 [Trifolium pratense]